MFTLGMELGKKAGDAIKACKAEYDNRKGAVSVGALAGIVLQSTRDWDPKIKGTSILTPALRASLANALAGLAFNISAAENGKALQ